MPISRVHVDFVHAIKTKTGEPETMRYEVYATEPITARGDQRFSTLNMFQAALCQEAGKRGQAVDVSWQETVYGPAMVTVSLVKEDAA